jgi:hypothetical protein
MMVSTVVVFKQLLLIIKSLKLMFFKFLLEFVPFLNSFGVNSVNCNLSYHM